MVDASTAVVNKAFDVLVDVPEGLKISDLADRLGVHKTVAGSALKQLQEAGFADRVRGVSKGGQPPWVYFLIDTNPQIEAPSSDTKKNKHRPVTKKRTKRGHMTELVLQALPHWKPNGRGFTMYQLHARIGEGSYETVRHAVAELVEAGKIIKTDKCRKGARVYLPAPAVDALDSAPARPVEVAASPVNLAAGLEALLQERDTLRQEVATREARLAEIELELDAVRARLA